MDISSLGNGLGLYATMSVPILASIVGAGLVAGVLRAATLIDDVSLSLVAKLTALAMLLTWGGPAIAGQVTSFAQAMWSAF